jgi:hypothetical protein
MAREAKGEVVGPGKEGHRRERRLLNLTWAVSRKAE